MILVLGGTIDGRGIARALRKAGREVLLTTTTTYGAVLADEGITVRPGALDREALAALLGEATALVDATHPFATAISALAIELCAERGVPYLRFERPGSSLPEGVHLAGDADEAARLAVGLAQGGTIFLTVGSKTLPAYLDAARAASCRVVARVLPTAAILAECEHLGMLPRDLIAMQGPTSTEVDTALLRHVAAKVLVTKESGPAGGVEEKFAAAEAAGIPVIVVGRPPVAYPRVVRTVQEVFAELPPC